MKEKKGEIITGLSFLDILFFIFLILKLCGVIEWSWLWVCAPLWIPVAILATAIVAAIVTVGIYGFYVCIYNFITKWRK